MVGISPQSKRLAQNHPVGLINPNCVGIIGSGVVVHIPSFFSELEKLEAKGVFHKLSELKSHLRLDRIELSRSAFDI